MEKLIDEYINSPAGADMAFEVNDEYSRAEVRAMFESGELAVDYSQPDLAA